MSLIAPTQRPIDSREKNATEPESKRRTECLCDGVETSAVVCGEVAGFPGRNAQRLGERDASAGGVRAAGGVKATTSALTAGDAAWAEPRQSSAKAPSADSSLRRMSGNRLTARFFGVHFFAGSEQRGTVRGLGVGLACAISRPCLPGGLSEISP